MKWGFNVLKSESNPQLRRGAHLNYAWPWPAGCCTHLLTRASKRFGSPPPRFPLASLTLFSSSQGLFAAQERDGGGGWGGTSCCVRVKSQVSVGEKPDLDQILKSNSSCVFLPVWSGRWAELRVARHRPIGNTNELPVEYHYWWEHDWSWIGATVFCILHLTVPIWIPGNPRSACFPFRCRRIRPSTF